MTRPGPGLYIPHDFNPGLGTFGEDRCQVCWNSEDHVVHLMEKVSMSKVHTVDDYGGSGRVTLLYVNDVLIWTWAWHIDGPPSDDMLMLLNALQSIEGEA